MDMGWDGMELIGRNWMDRLTGWIGFGLDWRRTGYGRDERLGRCSSLLNWRELALPFSYAFFSLLVFIFFCISLKCTTQGNRDIFFSQNYRGFRS